MTRPAASLLAGGVSRHHRERQAIPVVPIEPAPGAVEPLSPVAILAGATLAGIERCPACQIPTHASESTDAGLCAPCAALDGMFARLAAKLPDAARVLRHWTSATTLFTGDHVRIEYLDDAGAKQLTYGEWVEGAIRWLGAPPQAVHDAVMSGDVPAAVVETLAECKAAFEAYYAPEPLWRRALHVECPACRAGAGIACRRFTTHGARIAALQKQDREDAWRARQAVSR